MRALIALPALMLLAAAASCSSEPVFSEQEGRFALQTQSPSGKFLVTSSTMSSRVFWSYQGKVELVAEIELYFQNEDQQIRGYPLDADISDDGLLVVNIQGVNLEAWQINQGSKSASKVWTVRANNNAKSIQILEDQQKVLISQRDFI